MKRIRKNKWIIIVASVLAIGGGLSAEAVSEPPLRTGDYRWIG